MNARLDFLHLGHHLQGEAGPAFFGGVNFAAQQQKQQLIELNHIDDKMMVELEQVLSLDPRPAYQNDEQRIYKMKFALVDVSFTVGLDNVNIMHIEPIWAD